MDVEIRRLAYVDCEHCDEVCRIHLEEASDDFKASIKDALQEAGWCVLTTPPGDIRALCPQCGNLDNLRERMTPQNAKRLIRRYPGTDRHEEIKENGALRRDTLETVKISIRHARVVLDEIDDPADEIDKVSDACAILREAIGTPSRTDWKLGLDDLVEAYLG